MTIECPRCGAITANIRLHMELHQQQDVMQKKAI